ncbi:unnamed protein product, partial [Iphiclides podalirius]
MQKLQDSVFSIVKTTNLAPGVFSFLQPNEDFTDKTPLGGILKDTRHGWLALGPKFCVVDLRSGLKVAARTFGSSASNSRITVTSVVELPTPLTDNSNQLLISLDYDNVSGMICVLHVNGSQILRCIQTEVVITELAVCDDTPEGPFMAFDNIVAAGTRRGEILVFDLNRASLIQALKDISQGYEHLVLNEDNATNIKFLPLKNLHQIDEQRDLAIENDDHLGVILNEDSLFEGQYIFRNPEGTVRMKAKRDHIRVTSLQYIPQLGSLAVGYNFGAFQIWNLLNLDLEFTSQVNVDCLPVTHFGFQEPCDDPRAFCYLWVVFSVIDRFEEEEFPLAVMYSLTYQGKRILSETKCLYQDFSSATIRFQVELSASEDVNYLLGGRCVSCHTYSIASPLGEEGEDTMLNICQVVWECWGENATTAAQYGMLLFDLDQWYKDQMPATYRLESSAFMSVTWLAALGSGRLALDARLHPASVVPYSHATRLEEHFFPNSLQYNCICLNTSEVNVLRTVGVQRQIINSIDEAGPTSLLSPARFYHACVTAGLSPLYADIYTHSYERNVSQEEQRRFLLSVALEARLSRFLKRCAHDWATGTHSGLGCTLDFLVDWCWKRAIELKENAKELAAPLFTSSTLPDRNIVRCLEYCVQQLTQLTGLLDAILTKCCNLVVPDALSEMEEKHKGVGTVALYFQVVQWFLRVGLLPERHDAFGVLPYPSDQLYGLYKKRRLKLHRLQNNAPQDEEAAQKSCSLLYIDQLLEHEFGGQRVHQMWLKGGSECGGLYPPPSLYCLLRLYLLPDIAEEHKHSLVLYLLLDYSMLYDDMRYEAIIRRLMQFPTMFGLSNTAIKATQAFWHLDHRDFDFALDQLQCLSGNTLSEWQHSVVLSSLLAQKKSQAALQYLHVRKPAPARDRDGDSGRSGNARAARDKLDDWRPCCDLYLARGLLFEALDVVRVQVQNAPSDEERVQVLNFFFKGCRNTGQLAKILQATLLPTEEEVFIKYLKDCNDAQTSDILIMYYLQQARYLEAEEYNIKLKEGRGRAKELSTSAESLADQVERCHTRDTLVGAACAALPSIACRVARTAGMQLEPHVIVPKPMSVYVKAKSPKNTFTYKSSFIQDTIENASETWINKPKLRKGLKRALEIEDTPFICTPKLNRTKSLFSAEREMAETPPAKRARHPAGSPVGRGSGGGGGSGGSGGGGGSPRGTFRASRQLSEQMAALLDMPEANSPRREESRAGTPHSILKNRRNEVLGRDAASPVDSHYLADSDDELLETGSNHTCYSDSKQLRFRIPPGSESGSGSPSPVPVALHRPDRDRDTPDARERVDSPHPMESPPKKLATEGRPESRKSYKDSVRARRSLSMSANSSLSDDPNASIESIADIPVTLINPRYRPSPAVLAEPSIAKKLPEDDASFCAKKPPEDDAPFCELRPVPATPKGRRGIREIGAESTPLVNRSGTATPERQDSPTIAALRANRATRSRSRTPEALPPIAEQPRAELSTEPHATDTALSLPRRLRSRSRTPDLLEKGVAQPPTLEAITEAPTQPDAEPQSPSRRSLRSRSRTPDLSEKVVVQPPVLEAISESPTRSSNSESSSPSRRSLSRSHTPEVEKMPEQPVIGSPRSLRSRSNTPEKLITPKKDNAAKGRKPLSRIVLEANAFAKTKQATEEAKSEPKQTAESSEASIECTPMKTKPTSLMDVTFSPIVNQSVLQSSESLSVSGLQANESSPATGSNPLPAFATIHEVYSERSVLQSYQSSVEQSSLREESRLVVTNTPDGEIQSLPAFTTINETDFNRSILESYESSLAESSADGKVDKAEEEPIAPRLELKSLDDTEFGKSVLGGHQSSVDNTDLAKSALKDASSLMTSDSDADIRDQQKWKYDGGDTARDIQREKERIVEIEREINEIEGEFSEEEGDGSTDGEIVVGEEEEAEEEQSSDSGSGDGSSNDEASGSDSDDEIISIADSDSEPESSKRKSGEQITDEGPKVQESVESQTERIIEVHVETNTETAREITSEANNEKLEEQDNKPNERIIEVVLENTSNAKTEVSAREEQSTDVLNQANFSLLTDDNSATDSDVNLTYSDDSKDKEEAKEGEENPPSEKVTGSPPVEVQVEVMVEQVAPTDEGKIEDEPATEAMDVVDSTEIKIPPIGAEERIPEEPKIEGTEAGATTQVEAKEPEAEEPKPSRKRTISFAEATKEPETSVAGDPVEISMDMPKTPVTRKRSQSISSNKSAAEAEQSSPDDTSRGGEVTPGRRRPKTPTTEVRKILTRRASKELAAKGEEVESPSLDDSLTPRRRSTRSRSRNVNDDNASVASDVSAKSARSRASEEAPAKPAARKGRKSILNTKTDLSVIPEVAAEEAALKAEVAAEANEYTATRRLTRNQKSVMESWLQPAAPRGRRASAASRASRTSEASKASETSFEEEERAPDPLEMDRIALLDKEDYQGPPDAEELRRASPVPLTPDAPRPLPRLARAASESKSAPTTKQTPRRTSVDIAATQFGSPAEASPVRGRRASFNRACEALHTPKGKATPDPKQRAESESAGNVTPKRKPRRASTQSDVATPDTESGKRSRKTAAGRAAE